MRTSPAATGQPTAVQVNRPSVVAETFDGESVIVHLGTGIYYSLDELGTPLWELITGDCTVEGLVARLAEGASMPPTEAMRTGRTLLAELATEDLILIDGNLEPPDRPPARPVRLRRFTDLQDVLLVDPVHDLDLDGDGWPVNTGSGVGRPRER